MVESCLSGSLDRMSFRFQSVQQALGSCGGSWYPYTPSSVVQFQVRVSSRIHVQRDGAERELKAQRLELVATYDLTVDPRRFCKEQICAREPADYDKD